MTIKIADGKHFYEFDFTLCRAQAQSGICEQRCRHYVLLPQLLESDFRRVRPLPLQTWLDGAATQSEIVVFLTADGVFGNEWPHCEIVAIQYPSPEKRDYGNEKAGEPRFDDHTRY
jgi:hypothetical protein